MAASDAAALSLVALVLLVVARRPLAYFALRALAPVAERKAPLLWLRLVQSFGFQAGPAWERYTLAAQVSALKDLGRTASALDVMERLLAKLPRDECPWFTVNQAVDLFVYAGLYRRALDVTELWSKDARIRGRRSDEIHCAITRINQAEALHNLGYDEAALSRLESVFHVAQLDPLAQNGLRCLRAWILVHRGEFVLARSDLSQIVPDTLPGYQAEIHYTWAALERELGDLKKALQHAERGLRLARSASSRRNGMFMLADVIGLNGDSARAVSLFNEAVSSEYRGQGGDGLLRFADLLARRGDDEAAARILGLVLERDPESRFADKAKECLRSLLG